MPAAVTTASRPPASSAARAIEHADLVLSGDTGVAHLATAYAVPSITLFGPVPPSRWGAAIDDDLHVALWRGDPDADSWGDPHADAIDPRLEAIPVGDVLVATARLLSLHVDGEAP